MFCFFLLLRDPWCEYSVLLGALLYDQIVTYLKKKDSVAIAIRSLKDKCVTIVSLTLLLWLLLLFSHIN